MNTDKFMYRAKTRVYQDNKFVYGSLVVSLSGDIASRDYYIYPISNESPDHCMAMFVMVDPETIGQCTGLKDKNGKLIYEGDIALHEALPGAKNGRPVVFEDCCWMIKGKLSSDNVYLSKYSGLNMEIIGNIHDNPELMEVSQ